jgi:large subunit ribosomal protein L18
MELSTEAKARDHRTVARRKRHYRVRKRISGTEERPRLCVFRSNQHIYAQVIDDEEGHTFVGLGTVAPYVRERLASSKKSATKNMDAASVVGTMIAERCLERGITQVVFDRAGYKYHGKVAQLANSAREGGLQF